MNDNESLIRDIGKARAWVKQTRRAWENAKLQAKEAKEIHEGAISSLDELVAELTGESKRPLLAKIEENKEALQDRPWREWGLCEVLGLMEDSAKFEEEDASLVEAIREELEVATHEEPTLGDLAEWLRVNELEELAATGVLSAAEGERLRAALFKAREKFAWPDSIDEDGQGIPLAAIQASPDDEEGGDDQAVEKEELPLVENPAWGEACRFQVELKLTGNESAVVDVKHDGRLGMGTHLEFRSDLVSETGYRSHFLGNRESNLLMPEYARRFARHLARLRGKLAQFDPGDPSWWSNGVNLTGSPLDAKLANAAKKAGLRQLGDIAEAILLDSGEHLSDDDSVSPKRKGLSAPQWKAIRESIQAYARQQLEKKAS